MSDWYYADTSSTQGGAPKGPFPAQQFREFVRSGAIRPETLVWTAGMPAWAQAGTIPSLWTTGGGAAPAAPPPPAAPPAAPPDLVARVASSIGGLTGTDQVETSHVGGLFSQVLRRHDDAELEEVFTAGLRTTTPGLAQIVATAPSPWVYSRLLAFFGTAFVLLLLTHAEFPGVLLLPGILLIGSFAFPLATAVFFYECNTPRNVSLFAFAKLFVWGGILGIMLSLPLFNLTESVGEMIGPPIAGLIEEPGKLAAVVLLASATRYRWTLNGMCLGAAAGAGFAAFESAGYAMYALLSQGSIDDGIDGMLGSITTRGLLAPLAHVVWTAITAGALWRVMRGQPFRWSFLADRRCYAPLIAAMILHALWNSPLPLKIPFMLGYVGLGVVAWIIAIGMMLGALREIRAAQAAA